MSKDRSKPKDQCSELLAECDRICGHSDYHKDRCPLYKANCAAMERMNTAPVPAVPKMPPYCPACGGSGYVI